MEPSFISSSLQDFGDCYLRHDHLRGAPLQGFAAASESQEGGGHRTWDGLAAGIRWKFSASGEFLGVPFLGRVGHFDSPDVRPGVAGRHASVRRPSHPVQRAVVVSRTQGVQGAQDSSQVVISSIYVLIVRTWCITQVREFCMSLYTVYVMQYLK